MNASTVRGVAAVTRLTAPARPQHPPEVQGALALGRKALEPRPALNQHHPEDLLELLQSGRHGRLGDAAGLRRPSKVPLLGQRQQQFKLVNQYERPFGIGIIALIITAAPDKHAKKAAPSPATDLIAFPYRTIARTDRSAFRIAS